VQSFHKRTAGAETNVAIGLARLGLRWAGPAAWAPIRWAAICWRDAGEGIDCSHVVTDPAQRTGFQFKGRVTDGSDPPVEYHRKGSAASQMGPADIDADWLRSARHLHATGVFAAISAAACAAAQKTLD
jgi:dehydrogluconokinase